MDCCYASETSAFDNHRPSTWSTPEAEDSWEFQGSPYQNNGTEDQKTADVASKKSFTPASAPTNVSVEAEVFNVQKRLLQLRISWHVPTEGKKPESYNVHVEADKGNHPGCQTDPYYNFIPDKDATEWRVPVDPGDSVPHETLHILPSCRYRVSLEANPHDGRTSVDLLYTVPECVGSVCACLHVTSLPQPRVRVYRSDDNTVNITWRIFSPELAKFNVTAFLVGVGKEMMRSSGQKTVYNTSWLREVPARHQGRVYHLTLEAPGPGNYMASVKAVDGRQCQGAAGNHTFSVLDTEELAVTGFTKSEVVWMTALPSLSVALAACLVLLKLCQRCFLWARRRRHARPAHWTGIYKPISLDSGRSARVTFPYLQERNVLYVEKEIEEARQKGEADGYEVSYSRLALGRQIGKGAFGRVFLARAEAIAGVPGSSIVAVKKLKHKATVDEVEEFLSEIAMMKKVGRHPNVVTMVGCCTLTHPYCMIMEYVPCGDLLAYLRQLRSQHDRHRQLQQLSVGSRYSLSSDGSYVTPIPPRSCGSSVQPSASTRCSAVSSIAGEAVTLEAVLDPRELHSFATQIARGMAFLESKQITHRDLAARNILIDERKTLKISDFGLSRSGIYVNTKRRKVPLRWLSLEAMRDSLYSSKSDVWAFGVVLWEIGTLGGFPYPTVSDHELLEFLLSGKRLEQPDNISDELYALMEVCWSQSADDRPSFKDILFQLDSSPRKSVYVDFLPNQQLPPTEQVSAPASSKSTVS